MIFSESMPNESFENTKPEPKSTVFEKKIILATVIILVLNIMDGVFTIWGIRLRMIEEGNPLMQILVAKNAMVLIMTIKILLPIILGTACWWIRNVSRKLVSIGLGGIVIVYSYIMMLHVHWIYSNKLL